MSSTPQTAAAIAIGGGALRKVYKDYGALAALRAFHSMSGEPTGAGAFSKAIYTLCVQWFQRHGFPDLDVGEHMKIVGLVKVAFEREHGHEPNGDELFEATLRCAWAALDARLDDTGAPS